MGWAKFDDAYSDHPKVVAAGPLAELLDTRAIMFCARHETDGHVHAAQLTRLGIGIKAPQKQVQRLVEVGRWEPDPDGDGWWVHDFLDYNPSRAQKESEREAARERMRSARAAKNNKRSSGEQQPKFASSSGNPDPAPPHPKEKDTSQPSVSEMARELTREFALAVKGNGHTVPKADTPAQRDWLTEMDRLLRLGPPGGDPDPCDPGEVRRVIAFCAADDFEKANVLSPAKLRKRYSQLRIKAQVPPRLRAVGGFVQRDGEDLPI